MGVFSIRYVFLWRIIPSDCFFLIVAIFEYFVAFYISSGSRLQYEQDNMNMQMHANAWILLKKKKTFTNGRMKVLKNALSIFLS